MSGRHSVEEHLTEAGVEGLPFEGTPAAFVEEALSSDEGVAGFEDGEVGKVTGTDESTVLDAKEECGVVAHLGYQKGHPFLKHFVVVVALAGGGVEEAFHHHLQGVLDAGDASRGSEVGETFLGKGMGCMVGGDGVDKAVDESCPQGQTVVVGLDGWVAFDFVAQFGIVAVVEPEVVGCYLGGDVLFLEVFIAEEREFGGGADMCDMETGTVFAGTLDGFVGGDKAGFAVADFGVQVGFLAFFALELHLVVAEVGLYDAFVFAVRHYQFTAFAKETVEGVGFVDEHVACAAAEEKFDGGIAEGVDGEELLEVVVGGSQHEAVVDGTLLGCNALFGFQLVEGGGLRLGVGHVDDGGDSSGEGCAAFGGEVGFVGESGVAEMDMGVNNPGEDIASFGREGLRFAQGGCILDKTTVMDEEVAFGEGAFVDDSAVGDDVVH